MVLINVLDPAKHKADISEKTMQVNDGVAVLDEVGVLLEGLTIKADATPLEAGKDYTTTWNNDGTLNIVLLKGGAGEKATTLTATGSKIDPSKVKAADIVGGVDISSGKETGLEVVRQVYPKLSMTPAFCWPPGSARTPRCLLRSRQRPRASIACLARCASWTSTARRTVQ